MKKNLHKLTSLGVLSSALVLGSLEGKAVSLSAGNAFRTATLGDATSVNTGSGNATAAIVNDALPTGNPADPWVEVADIAGGSGGPGDYTDSNNKFKIVVTTGSWGGGGPLSGTWQITDASFWTTYGYAAISMHVGNGSADPDHWIWEIENGKTSGTWSYERLSGGGGGLSNFKLYGHGTGGTGTSVPDGGFTMALLGLATCGFGLISRNSGKTR